MGFWKRFWLFCNLDKRSFAKVSYEKAIPGWLVPLEATHKTSLSDPNFLIEFMEKYLGWTRQEAEYKIMKMPINYGDMEIEYSMWSKFGEINVIAKKRAGSYGEWDVKRLTPRIGLGEFAEDVEAYD